MIRIYETNSPEETFSVGQYYGENAAPGEVVCLDGSLGVGKTVFVKGFAKGLGIADHVVSPTFTILQVYEGGRLPMYHFDVYRIEDEDEMEEIGHEEFFYGEGVSLVEWAVRIEDLIPEYALRVTIEKDPEKGFDYRKITVASKDKGPEKA
ncbi:MAG: tRNA (adenosine(37)-N6)-threonylcarbamoyltransferase complex ATPase subunit type 1 TsaE [Lachnospiraceae bacterium]|nr:tRNA (adenosine(37)-N6)-threonylcarbamoyltransferase complex ATPase subunit type 1 TsaE [Lachnospiraceae bacterium]